MMCQTPDDFDFERLLKEGISFNFHSTFIKDQPLDNDEMILNPDSNLLMLEAITIGDEDALENATFFERLAKQMFDITEDGKVKKRILREGCGNNPPDYSKVKIHYSAYVEMDETPFDSTYILKKPKQFSINRQEVIPGLDIAVQSMRLNEKSQFLLHHEYAYRNASTTRIPPYSSILFEVELIEIIDIGFIVKYEEFPEEEQQKFSNVYQYCLSLNTRGKYEYKSYQYKKAIISYNTALAALDKIQPESREDILKHRELYMKLLTNLLVCQTTENPKKGIKTVDKIYKFTEDGILMKIPVKVYFFHAKCLRLLNEPEKALPILKKARELEPKNIDIAREFILLDKDIDEQRTIRKNITTKMFQQKE